MNTCGAYRRGLTRLVTGRITPVPSRTRAAHVRLDPIRARPRVRRRKGRLGAWPLGCAMRATRRRRTPCRRFPARWLAPDGGAGCRHRHAPHQRRHAHAVEMAYEGVPLIEIQRQLWPQRSRQHLDQRPSIDNAECSRPFTCAKAPTMPVSTSLPNRSWPSTRSGRLPTRRRRTGRVGSDSTHGLLKRGQLCAQS